MFFNANSIACRDRLVNADVYSHITGGLSSIAEKEHKRIVRKDGVLANAFCYTGRLLKFDEKIGSPPG